MFETNGVRIEPDVVTRTARAGSTPLQSNAAPIGRPVETAGEAARQSGVYPGVLRDLRRRYRMNWSGWDR